MRKPYVHSYGLSMKYVHPSKREAFYFLGGIILSTALLAIYAKGKIESANMRAAKAQIALSRLASEIESIEDHNEADIANIKSLAKSYVSSLERRANSNDSIKVEP